MKLFSKLRAHKGLRYISFSLTIVVAILAATVVSTLTIDLGPALRAAAERAGTSRLKRPVHIGRLSLHVFRGRVLLEDFAIDGRSQGDTKFFTAKLLSVSLDWSKAIARRPEFVITSVELTDWFMTVEEWNNGHSFPKFTSDNNDTSSGPRRFTTTLQYLRAWRGQFVYENHEAPWGVVAPNIDLNITYNLLEPHYRGQATFTGGNVHIQDHLPMWTAMKARFAIGMPLMLRMERIGIDTDGAETTAIGTQTNRWPEMLYDVKSRVNFAHARALLQGRAVGAGGRGRLHRPIPFVQWWARPLREFHQRCARGVRVSVPLVPWIAALDTQTLRGHQRRRRSVRRRGPI